MTWTQKNGLRKYSTFLCSLLSCKHDFYRNLTNVSLRNKIQNTYLISKNIKVLLLQEELNRKLSSAGFLAKKTEMRRLVSSYVPVSLTLTLNLHLKKHFKKSEMQFSVKKSSLVFDFKILLGSTDKLSKNLLSKPELLLETGDKTGRDSR